MRTNPVDPDEVPKVVRDELEDCLARALDAGMREPFEYVGAGMTSLVFRSGEVAYKVARIPDLLPRDGTAWARANFRQEADYLESVGETPYADQVTRLHLYDEDGIVLVKEYVEGRVVGTASAIMRELWEGLYEALKNDWGPPEYKADSFVLVGPRGRETPVLVDAGFTHRRGENLARYVMAVLGGRIDDPLDIDWPWELRQEGNEGRLDERVARRLAAEVEREIDRVRPPR